MRKKASYLKEYTPKMGAKDAAKYYRALQQEANAKSRAAQLRKKHGL